jgi:hypothetical protein
MYFIIKLNLKKRQIYFSICLLQETDGVFGPAAGDAIGDGKMKAAPDSFRYGGVEDLL